MANLVVRNLGDEIVQALKERAARNQRSAEAEHRAILEHVLLRPRRKSFAQVLASMPDVGRDDDFERVDDEEAMMVPTTSGGAFARDTGLTVPITGHDTTGVAVCNQIRSFDIEARERAGSARYVETLDVATTAEIISRVISVIDPAG